LQETKILYKEKENDLEKELKEVIEKNTELNNLNC
jgi:hypothetical protein